MTELPKDFLYGFASASYQIEGGTKSGGRGPCVWDEALQGAKDNGDDACDSYNRWREDVELLKTYGAKSYRFSISWSRVIPKGGKDDPVNLEGIKYYSDLIDALLGAGITPLVTLFHWDTPLELHKRYRGFLAAGEDQKRLVQDFERYATLCFKEFGGRVKHWITHNEPMIFTMCTVACLEKDTFDMNTDRWHELTQNGLGENLLLTHGRAVSCYRKHFKAQQGGVIGITLNIEWVEPIDDSAEAKSAAQQSLDIMAGYFADPIYLGKHNKAVIEMSKGRVRDFTPDEWAEVAHSSDFFGVNHYSTRYATGKPLPADASSIEYLWGGVEQVTERDGIPIGYKGHNGHPFIVPWGFEKLLKYINKTWCQTSGSGDRLAIYVTENGFAEQDEGDMPLEKMVQDAKRQEYFTSYIEALMRAVKDGVQMQGYFGWSLLDNLEWMSGYGPRFGVTHVDRANDFKRTPKQSAFLINKTFEKLLHKS